MAAGLTGSVNSVDVSGLKVAEGKPHDLGQFYIVIDPAAHSDAFFDRFARLEAVIAADAGARLPGTNRKNLQTVSVSDDLWEKLSGYA